MSEENDVDLLALALSNTSTRHTFTFKGALYEVKPPSMKRQDSLRLMAQVPVLDGLRKPIVKNGVPVTKLDNSKYAALLVIETVYYPGGERAVFGDKDGKPSKTFLDSVLSMPTDDGSFLKVSQPVIMKSLGVSEDGAPAALMEEEEGNSEGVHGSAS